MASQTKEKKKPRPKVVAVIIEGESEFDALHYQLEEFLDGFGLIPVFCLMYKKNEDPGGDITSRSGVKPENLDQKISQYLICPSLRNYGILESDIVSVVQIVDTDGAFISDDHIQVVKELEHPEEHKSFEYYADHIKALNLNNAIVRNLNKSTNLRALTEKKQINIYCYTRALSGIEDNQTKDPRYEKLMQEIPLIKSVPYFIYFYSCNFDHFTCGERNLPRADKTKKAGLFSSRIAPDLDGLKRHFNKHPGTLKGKTHRESWEFIAKDLNSLQQFTNVHLLLEMKAEDFRGPEEE